MLKVLNDFGILLLHDYYPNLKRVWPTETPIPGPYRAFRDLHRTVGAGTLQDIPLGELPWPTRLGSILALIARA